MITFPNCKINLGLHVTGKRPDGYHNIETVFYPVGWCDAIEVLKSSEGEFELTVSGLPVSGKNQDNLVYKAWQLLQQKRKVPPMRVHLHKHVPMGAGLGGGSADAAFFINMVNQQFELNLPVQERLAVASELGSDCAFFISNHAVEGRGKGNEFSAVSVDLSQYYLLVVFPGIHSNTREAYEGLVPATPAHPLRDIVQGPVTEWRSLLVNDFEISIFKKYPVIGQLKQMFYEKGAVYASMSGSGSAVFGIFRTQPAISFPSSYQHFLQKPGTIIL